MGSQRESGLSLEKESKYFRLLSIFSKTVIQFLIKSKGNAGLVPHVFNQNTWEAESRQISVISSQSGIQWNLKKSKQKQKNLTLLSWLATRPSFLGRGCWWDLVYTHCFWPSQHNLSPCRLSYKTLTVCFIFFYLFVSFFSFDFGSKNQNRS